MTPARPRAPYCGGYSSNHHRHGASFPPQSDRLFDIHACMYRSGTLDSSRDSSRPTDRPEGTRRPNSWEKIRARSAVRVASVSPSFSNVAGPARALPSSDGISTCSYSRRIVNARTHERSIERMNERASDPEPVRGTRSTRIPRRVERARRARGLPRCVGGKKE